jgi:hypothetical protein
MLSLKHKERRARFICSKAQEENKIGSAILL